MDNHQQPVRRSQRLLSYLICTLIGGQPLLPAVAAAINPVTPGSQMDKAANGVPVLNIATPNQAGISHNQFSDYNVGKPGLILNNATDRLTQTQLGGLIQNNPNLKAGKEARGIINEVVGGNRSQLQGFTEVAGKAANVMVVNPYGITCNGCGFINTPQVTLTTGKPTFDSQGNVSSLAVSKGTIIVEGQGLNASQSDALSIIARATEINADIHARDLTVIAGSNRVDAQGKVTAQGSQDPQPSVAVDTGALGGMYANRIRLVSSDKGVGVNLGNLNARQGDITLDASGKLTLNNSLASGALSIRAEKVALSGDHKAGGDITVSSDGDVALKNAALVSDRDVVLSAGKKVALESGKLTAGRDIQLSGDALTVDNASQANAAGGIRATATTTLSQQGQLTAGQDLTLNADALDNRGALNASRNLSARTTTLRNSGTMQSSGDLTLTGDKLNNQGKMLSGGALTLTASQLEQHGTLSAKADAHLTVSDRLTQGAQGEILSDGLLSMRAGQLEQQGLLSGDRGVNFSGDNLDQQQGARITSQQAIDLQADRMQLGGEVNAGGDLTLAGSQLTTQSTAQVQSGGNLKLAAQQATLNGTHAARGDLIVNATTLSHNGKSNAARIALTADRLNNHGTLVAPELSLSTQHLTNGGLLDGSRSLQLQTDLFDNLQGATLHSAGNLSLSPAQLNNAGLIASDGDLTLVGDSLFNRGEINAHNLSADYLDLYNQQGGLLLAQGQLTTVSQSLDNAGQMAAVTLRVSGDRIENSGTLQGNDSLALKAHTINSQGDMLSGGALKIDGDSLNNGGALQGAVLALTLVQQFANQQGAAVNATRSLAIDAATVVNDGQMVTPALTLNAETLNNTGLLQGDEELIVTSTSLDNQAGGQIRSQQDAQLTAQRLLNSGKITAQNLDLYGNNLSNSGLWQGNDRLAVTAVQLIQSRSAQALSGGSLDLNSQTLISGGTLQGQQVTVTADSWQHQGTLIGGTAVLAHIVGTLANNGEILSQGNAELQAATLNNTGHLLGGAAVTLRADELTNQGAVQGNTLTMYGDSLVNDGSWQAQDMVLNADNLTNAGWLEAGTLHLNVVQAKNSGTMLSQQQAILTGNSLTNQGRIQADRLTSGYQQLNNSGTLLGNSQLAVTAERVEQQDDGKLLSGGDLTLNTNDLSASGQLMALGDMTLALINGLTHRGTLAAANQLKVTSNGAIDNQGVMQGQSVNLSAGGALTNNGKITTGRDASTLSGSQINLNDAGSVQGGGDISLTSRGDINVAGFTGTSGSLSLTTPGSIINTALLYAGQDMRLQANSIRNQRGDILADNNLWMQRDIAGNANSEIINTSGTIETRNGDITMATAHLLNQRDGLHVTKTTQKTAGLPEGVGGGTLNIRLGSLGENELGYYTIGRESGGSEGPNGSGKTTRYSYYLAPNASGIQKRYLTESTVLNVTANGGAGRIASGRNIDITATTLDNVASNILADKTITLRGSTLNNQSWLNSIQRTYLTYVYAGQLAASKFDDTRKLKDFTQDAAKSITYRLAAAPEHETESTGGIYRSIIQAGGAVSATFSNNISNTTSSANAGGISHTLATPALNALSQQTISDSQQQTPPATVPVLVGTPQWRDLLQGALQAINGGSTPGKDTGTSATDNNGVVIAPSSGSKSLQDIQAKTVDTSAWPLPSSDNGYFIASPDPKSPYLITINPKLNGLGQLDQSLYGDLYKLLQQQPESAARESRSQYTDEKQFLGSAYLLNRLKLVPEYDYRFLGDAAFDTRYVSNTVLNQTGNQYLNGIGSALEQMRYLMDNAVASQQGLGLKFGISLNADQVAALDHSIIWWEAATINGETVMVPKVYLSTKDVTVHNGSVIAGNDIQLEAGSLTNQGSAIVAANSLKLESQNAINNRDDAVVKAGGNLQLSAVADINNIGAKISGKTVALESTNGSIINRTEVAQWQLSSQGHRGEKVSLSHTYQGSAASVTALDGLTLNAGKDISITGAQLKAGGDLLLKAGNDIAVTENTIDESQSQSGFAYSSRSTMPGSASTNLSHQGSNLSAGGSLTLNAGHDLSVSASALNAAKDMMLAAGQDLNLNAADTAQRSSKGKGENHVTGQDRTTLTSGNDLTLSAGRDLNSQAAGLVADNDVTLQAGRDVNLLAATTTKGDSYRSSERTEIHEAVRQQGTEIASGGNTAVQAGRDINSAATQVTAQQDIALKAGNDVNLTTATESDYFYKEETKTKKGFLSKKTTHTIKEDSSTSEKGSLLSGDNVSVEAGKNILVKGSQVVGDDEVTLKAAGNIDIVAATNTDSSWRFSETKKSGLMGTGGIGITIGTSSQKHDLKVKGTTQSQSVSTVGSTGGNVTVSAADGVKISGADLVAGQSLTVNGDSVIIAPGHDKRTVDERFEQKSTGITLALSGAVGEAINNAIATAQSAKGESDSRLAALQATKTALSGVQAKLASQQAQVSGDPNSGIGISISLTTQKSESQSQQVSDAVSGSTLNAGQNLAITATGKGQSANSGDIAIGGSQLKAGGDTTLTAANDILLTGAANTQQSTGSNSSGGGGVGISFGVGNGSAGLSIFASVNGAKGKDAGNGTQWSETTLDSGGNVSLNSGRDTTLTGAQVNGNKVSADVGRNLTITSQQDSDRYDSKQTSFGAGGSFTFGSMTASGYINASQDKMHSTYDSVMEQSGIYAGKGGFDIQVGDHTQLNGAVIASQAGADNNRLETGTLGFSDLGNEADYKVSHSGISAGMSNGGSMGGQMLGNVLSNSASTLLAGLNGKGHAEGTTQSAVEQGTIVIRDTANQRQDVGSLSRDTASANGSISPIFDKEKEQKRLQTAQAVGEITGQMVSIVNTMGDIKGLEEAKKGAAPLKDNATEKERAKWLAGLRESDAYQKAMSDYGVGSKNQMVVQAIGGVLQGLVNGNISQAVAGAANPLVAQVIKAQTTDASGKTNVTANAMAHAVWGAVAAQMSGGNAAAGAAGAFSGELATRFIAEAFYHASTPEDIARLSQADKEQLSLLGTIAAGAAGAVAGNSSAAATTGALAGKNAVENNALSAPDDKQRQDAKWSLPYLEGEKKAQAQKLVSDLNAKDKAFDAAMDSACKNLSSAACQGMRQELAAMGRSYDEKLDGQYVGNMGSVYKEGKGKVDALMWQYASADAKAERDANINRIAENWGVSKEAAATLYDGMAVVHTTAAIGGAAYGMKGSSSAAKGSTSVVESEKAALDRISQNAKDTVNLNSKQNYSVLDQQAAKSSVIIEQDKLKYLFGEVNSSAHNTPRSTQLAQSMYRLGIPLDDAGAKLIMDHISQVPKKSGNIVNVYTNQFGKFEVRESLLMGPSGKAAKLETSFQIMDDGSRRFVTTIPKDGKK